MQNPRFEVRETEAELKLLDEALIKNGYIRSNGNPDRAGWYREQKRKLITSTDKSEIEYYQKLFQKKEGL